MHFESKLVYTVVPSKLRGLFPVRNHFLFPLPIQNLRVFGRPAISSPVRHRLIGSASRTSRESDNYSNSQSLRQQHRVAESRGVALRDFGIRVHRIAVTTQRRHQNVAIVEL